MNSLGPKVPAQGPPDAKIMIVGEAPGVQEVESLAPFVGSSGVLLSTMLKEAGFDRQNCYVTNVCKFRPPRNEIEEFFGTKTSGLPLLMGRYCHPPIVDGIKELEREISLVNPDLILAFGNTALWACTGESGIGKWRGSVLACRALQNSEGGISSGNRPKVIPTYHPAAVLRNFPLRATVVNDLRRARRELTERGRTIVEPEYKFQIRPSFDQVLSVLSSLQRRVEAGPCWIAADIETQRRKIDCIGLAWSRTEAFCIPIIQMDVPAERRFYWSVDEQVEIVLKLRELMTHPNCWIIGQNFPYDMQYIAREWGFLPNLRWDTMTIHHSIFSCLPMALDYQSSLYCDFHRYWKEDAKDEGGYRLGDEDQWIYNCRDIVVTFEVREKQEILLSQLKFPSRGGMTPQERQMSLHHPMLKAMLRGVKSSYQQKQKVLAEIEASIKSHEEWLSHVVGHPFNPRSYPQLQKFFYTDMRIKPVISRKTKKPTTDEEALIKIAKRDPLLAPICEVINDVRSLGTFRSVCDVPLDKDFRFRCSYKIPGTTTYRFASKSDAFGFGTNLANISGGSRGDEEALAKEIRRGMAISGLIKPNLRKLFIPDTGYTICEFDLPQADARVVAWDANDETLKAIFNDPTRDIHTENAKLVFGECFGKEDPRRYFAKEAVHATNYLVTAITLAATLHCTVPQATNFIFTWFKLHPKIPAWHNRLRGEAATRKYVENAFGYRRYCFDRLEDEIKEIVAWIGQSTVAVVTNTGLARVDADLCTKGVDLLLQCHDSAVFQIWTKDGSALAKAILERMMVEVPYDDPLIMVPDAKFSEISWGDCEKRSEWLKSEKTINVPHQITQAGEVLRTPV